MSELRYDMNHALLIAFKSFFRSLLHAERLSVFTEIPGARAFLKQLRKRGFSTAIATGCWRSTAFLKLERAGFDLLGVPMACSSDARTRVEILQLALAALEGTHKRRFDQITYFGDASWDLQAAKTLGWNFVGIGPTLSGERVESIP